MSRKKVYQSTKKMAYHIALIKWESGELAEIPMANLTELAAELKAEIEKRNASQSIAAPDAEAPGFNSDD